MQIFAKFSLNDKDVKVNRHLLSYLIEMTITDSWFLFRS